MRALEGLGTSIPSRPNRIGYLDGIRALAILSVVAVHWLPLYMPARLPVFKGAYIGVDLFLVLSGYLITRILWQSRAQPIRAAYAEFLWRRFWRLYPALLGMLAILTPLAFLAWGPADGMKAALRAVAAALQLTSVVAALGLGTTTPFEQTWTLGWEWYFYLVWPLALLALRNRGVSALKAAAWSAGLGAVFYLLSAALASGTVMYYGPLGRFSQLLMGSALGLFFLARPAPPAISRTLRTACMTAAGTVFLTWALIGPNEHDRLYGLLGFPLATASALVLIAMGYQRETDPVPRALSSPGLKNLGLCSYSIYLWHLPLLRIAQGPNFAIPSPAAALAAALATIVLSRLSHTYLEKPFLRGRRPVRQGALSP